MFTTAAGFGLALIVGVLAAIGITYSKFLEQSLYTLLVSLNSIPKIALAPLFMIWLGTGMLSKIAVAFLIAVFAIVVDGVLGLRSVDPDAINLLRSVKATRFQELIKLRLPNALPHMFAGMKVAISLALVGSIAGEFLASQEGLGFVILSSQSVMQTTRVFAAIILLGVMGTLLFYLVGLAERIICPWHISHRSAE
jgi:NitT/TauT family transport system permease protein